MRALNVTIALLELAAALLVYRPHLCARGAVCLECARRRRAA